MKSIIFGSIVLLALAHQVVGADDEVNCYQCGSFPDLVTSVKIDCPADDNFDDFKGTCKLADGQACIKIESDNGTYLFRGCQKKDFCTTFETKLESDCLTCDDDKCNTAASLGTSVLLLASAIVASVCLVRS